MKKRLLSLLLVAAMVMSLFTGMTITVSATNQPTHDAEHDGWTEMQQANNFVLNLSEGNYYLADDIVITGSVNVAAGATVTICLNGHVMDLGSRDGRITLAEGSTLNICDCQANSVTTYGNIDGETGLWTQSNQSGNANLSGGVITNTVVAYRTSSLIYSAESDVTLNLYSGNIAGGLVGNESYASSAGIEMIGSGSVNLYGGKITGCVVYAINKAAALHLKGMDLLLAGTIIENNKGETFGGVYWTGNTDADIDAEATMTGGAIKNNTADREDSTGGLYINDGTFTMTEGEISGNEGCTGGVKVGGTASFNMQGGEIENNSAVGQGVSYGGGIYLSGKLSMTDGSITGNTSDTYGGGIYVANNGDANISGGTISENSTSSQSAQRGGGVFVSAMAATKLTLSGDPIIYDNTTGNGTTQSNVTLYGDSNINSSHQKIIVGEFSQGAKVGVGFEHVKGYRTFTSGATGDVTPYFVSDNPDYIIAMTDDGQAYIGYKIELTTEVTGGTNHWSEDDEMTTIQMTPNMVNASDVSQSTTFNYKWYYASEEDLSDATTFTSLTNDSYIVTRNGSYYYFCEVSDNDGMAPPVRSEAVYVVYKQSPIIRILQHPQGMTLYPEDLEDENKLTINASTNIEAELSYQWYKCETESSSSEMTLIPGANDAEYVLPSDLEIGNYYYRCIVSAEGTSPKTSGVATVSVVEPSITFTTNLSTGTEYINMGAEKVLSVQASCEGYSGQLSYQWYTCDNNNKGNSTAINGATGSSYSVPTTAVGDKYFYCKVSAGNYSKDSNVANIYVRPLDIIFDTNIRGTHTVDKNGTLSLTISARVNGDPDRQVNYQWYKSNNSNKTVITPIQGATGSSFSVPTDTAANTYYFCRVTIDGTQVYEDTNVVLVKVMGPSHNITTADPIGQSGYAEVDGGKYKTYYATGEEGKSISPFSTWEDNGYIVDKYIVYKTDDPSVKIEVDSYGDFIMPEFDVTIKVTFKPLEPITKVDIYMDWNRVPEVSEGTDIRSLEFNEYIPTAYIDAIGAANGPAYCMWAIKVTNSNKSELVAAMGDMGQYIDEMTSVFSGYVPTGYLRNSYELKETDELAVIVGTEAYNGYTFPMDAQYNYTGTVTCNSDILANVVEYGLMSIIEAGTADDISNKKSDVGELYDVYFYDYYGYTNGGSYGVKPGIAEAGDTITIRVTPDEGYQVASVTYANYVQPSNDGEGGPETIEPVDGKYTFEMPESSVIVAVTFELEPLNDADQVAAAKAAIQRVINNLVATNDTTEESIQDLIDAALENVQGLDGLTADVVITINNDATLSSDGSIVGSVSIVCGDEEDSVAINKTIAKLPDVDGEKIADAKEVIQEALDGLTVTNDTTKESIEALIEEALDDAGIDGVDTAITFNKTNATTSAAGSASISVDLSCGGAEDSVAVNKTIAKLVLSDDEKVDIAKAAVERALNGLNVTNSTTSSTIENLIANALQNAGVSDVSATVTFNKTDATTEAAGSAEISVELSSGGESDSVEANKTIAQLSSTSPSTNKPVDVPITNDENRVDVQATVSGNDATIKPLKEEEIQKLVGDSDAAGDVVIDLAGIGKTIDTAAIPKKTLEAIVEAAEDAGNNTEHLVIKLSTVELTIDDKAMRAIVDQADGEMIKFNFDDVGLARMNDKQKDAVKDMDVRKGYEAYITVNGKRVSDFNGGKVELLVPYTVPAGEKITGFSVWYIDEEGNPEKLESTYDGVNKWFVVTHFSDYVIVYSQDDVLGDSYDSCLKGDACPVVEYNDTNPAEWYHDGVHYCLDNGIMVGLPGNLFAPNGTTTRGQLVTILWRLEGEPQVEVAEGFNDVFDNDWYSDAISWATAKNIVEGYGDGYFGANDTVTREQMVTILWRYAQYKGYDVSIGEDVNILSYGDAFEISEYAIPAMQWACGFGVLNGIETENGDMILDSKNGTTRAQMATMIMRFCVEN